jgi:hypothetical protein
MSVKKTAEQFITGAQAVHGSKYDYTKVQYSGDHIKVPIVCSQHGEFHQTPSSHLQGHGCPRCRPITGKKDTTSFAESLYGNMYDYSAVIYSGSKTPVTIICPDHGPFEQRPDNHLSGQGCPICGKYRKSMKLRKSLSRFIQDAVVVHGDKYDYSQVDYVHTMWAVHIICPEHGVFLQTPDNHLHGNNCPRCRGSISVRCDAWLNSIGIPNTPAHREVFGLIPNRRYTVDGYDPKTGTVYEFHGDYWHGNPKKYGPDDVNPSCGLTFGYLYEKTLQKRQHFIDAGYQWVEIWESEWMEQSRRDVTI